MGICKPKDLLFEELVYNMQNVDTLKMYAPFDKVCKSWNSRTSRVKKITSIAGNAKELNIPPEEHFNINVKDLLGIGGRNGIEIYADEVRNKIIFEISSKIQGADYYKHITINSLEQALDNFNNALDGHIELYVPEFIENASIARIDILSDLKISEAERRRICLSLRRNPKDGYLLEPYGKGRKSGSGLVIKPIGDKKIRLTVYDKLEDMLRAENRAISLKYLHPYEHFTDITRTELILRGREKMRKYLNIDIEGEIPLTAGLQATAKPITKFLNTVRQADQEPLISELYYDRISQEKGWDAQQKIIRAIEIIRQYNYSLSAIREAMRPHYSGPNTLSTALKNTGYKKLIAYIKKLDDNEITLLENYIKELEA